MFNIYTKDIVFNMIALLYGTDKIENSFFKVWRNMTSSPINVIFI